MVLLAAYVQTQRNGSVAVCLYIYVILYMLLFILDAIHNGNETVMLLIVYSCLLAPRNKLYERGLIDTVTIICACVFESLENSKQISNSLVGLE